MDYDIYLPDIDIKEGVKRVMNKEKIYFMLLGKFKPREMAEDLIQKILSNDTPEQIRNSAHALKGSSANLSLSVIYQVALNIEEAAKNNKTGAEYIPELKEAVENFESKLKLLLNN